MFTDIQSEKVLNYFDRGVSLVNSGELEGALECFTLALETNPNFVACLNQMARIYEIKKDYPRAINCLQKVVELHPNPAGFQFILDRLILKHEAGAASGEYLQSKDFGTPEEERERLRAKVEQLQSLEQPIYLQFGFGDTPFVDFLNIDVLLVPKARNAISKQMHERIFLFLWLEQALPIPDNSVDFIFHQDLFEHLSQMHQFLLLAEARRILKPSCIHRINAPCIADSMRRNSDFTKGFDGVYTEEWTQHGHVNVPTRETIEEMARIVGYSHSLFNSKKGSVSGVKFREYRPGPDRDRLTGSVFADLIK
jgi:hypothetical protein